MFQSKGRVDEVKQEVRAAWKCVIFRHPKMTKFHYKEGVYSTEPGERHLDFIAQNVTYTPQENQCLIDLATDLPSSLFKL